MSCNALIFKQAGIQRGGSLREAVPAAACPALRGVNGSGNHISTLSFVFSSESDPSPRQRGVGSSLEQKCQCADADTRDNTLRAG